MQRLAPDGRLAYILPADIAEGVSAPALWRWIADHFRIEAVVTFEPTATPFPGVDTNPLIVFIRRAAPAGDLQWARCRTADDRELRRWVEAGCGGADNPSIFAVTRAVHEAVAGGLSRPPGRAANSATVVPLGSLARVVRGIATGANDFFFLTASAARSRGLPRECLRFAVGRTRDVAGDEIKASDLRALDARGRPTLLVHLDHRPLAAQPSAVRRYIQHGEALGLPLRPLISTRRPWYSGEERTPPPLLFAYLGRRNGRFIRNRADVVPLTAFLCVYPKVDADALWRVLQAPWIREGLARVGKSYGSGAVKVEPRPLERLSVPVEALAAEGILPPAAPGTDAPPLFE